MISPEELTERHLRKYAFWAFDLADEFDSCIRPLKTLSEIELNNRSVAVRTSFSSKSGNSFIGQITWYADAGIQFLLPAIVVGEERLDFYYGMDGISHMNFPLCNRLLGLDPFPIIFESEPSNKYHRISGQVDGFYYMNDEGEVLLYRF